MKIRRAAETVSIVCLALIMIISGWKVFTIMNGYRANQSVYDDISQKAQESGFTGDIDFAALSRINPDVIGWLYYEDSMINYPVVQGGVLLVATMIILVNLLVDLLYGVVNPRIRHKK